MNNVEKTSDFFSSGLNCSQAVLAAFGAQFGLDSEMAERLGLPLGGGMGRVGKTCGAVAAAVLILGLAKDHEDEDRAKKAVFSCVQELFRRFEALHGTTECRVLLGVDMRTDEGLKKVREENLFSTTCPAFVRDAADILDKLLAADDKACVSPLPDNLVQPFPGLRAQDR